MLRLLRFSLGWLGLLRLRIRHAGTLRCGSLRNRSVRIFFRSMTLIGHTVVFYLLRFPVFGHNLIGLPLGSRRAAALLPFSRCDNLHGRHRQVFDLLGNQIPLYTVRKNGNTVNLHCGSLVGIPCLDTDGMLGIVYKLIVRSRPGNRSIHSRRNIGRGKSMGSSVCRRKSRTKNSIVKCGGNLTYSSSDFFYNFSLIIGSCRLIPFLRSTLSNHCVEGELFSGFQNRSVQCFCSKPNICISKRIGSGLCRKGRNDFILILNGIHRCGHLCTDRFHFSAEALILNQFHDFCSSLGSIYRITVFRSAKLKFSGGLVILCNIAVLRSHLPHNGKLRDIIVYLIRKIGQL